MRWCWVAGGLLGCTPLELTDHSRVDPLDLDLSVEGPCISHGLSVGLDGQIFERWTRSATTDGRRLRTVLYAYRDGEYQGPLVTWDYRYTSDLQLEEAVSDQDLDGETDLWVRYEWTAEGQLAWQEESVLYETGPQVRQVQRAIWENGLLVREETDFAPDDPSSHNLYKTTHSYDEWGRLTHSRDTAHGRPTGTRELIYWHPAPDLDHMEVYTGRSGVAEDIVDRAYDEHGRPTYERSWQGDTEETWFVWEGDTMIERQIDSGGLLYTDWWWYLDNGLLDVHVSRAAWSDTGEVRSETSSYGNWRCDE